MIRLVRRGTVITVAVASAIAALGAGVVGCSDKSGGRAGTATEPEEPTPPAGDPVPPRDPAPPGDPATPTEPPPPRPRSNRVAELFAPPWKVAGVGQVVTFGVAAIDQDLDEVTVTVPELPASARFDALTQTVVWTPSKADLAAGKGSFRVHVVERHADGGVAEQDAIYDIPVVKKAQPVPTAPFLDPVAELLLTIREPARLAQVNKDWPLDAMLVEGARMLRATLPAEAQAKLGKLDRKALFTSVLTALAQTHQNPRIDPAATEFDRKVFGDPKAWRVVAVRPRLDKKFHELRVVYQAIKAPEPVFVMFRIRPVWDVPTLPPEARALNNEALAAIVARTLLTADGAVDERFVKDGRGHGKAVARLVKDVLAFKDPTQPWARAAFVALPTEARLGGGSKRAEDGSYASGDAWAWSVLKPMPTADGTAQAYVNMPIPGFWTQSVPSADGTAWTAKCAPKFDPEDPAHAPGYEVLCRKALGIVDQPEVIDGKVTPAKRDATNLFVDHKNADSVALLPIDDARRDHGEENGMTCAQCHIRNFGVRDYGDPATLDPRAGVPRAGNRPLATLNFQIVPTHTWEAFTVETMKDQQCKVARNLEVALGKPPALSCPLAP